MAGSIEKRGENTYRLVVSGGKNLDGTRCKKTKTIHGTRKDAEIALAEFITEVNRGLVPEGKSITFEEFFYIWDEKYASKELAPKTYSRYIGILKSRILPYLGSFPLDKIKPTDLMNFYDMLENDTQIKRIAKNNGQRTLKPLSPKTILEHHRLISAMLQNAVYWQLLPSNPARRVKPPKTKKPKMEFFNDDECKVLIQSLMELTGSNLKYKAAILLDIFSGVRRGELIGLEWSDVDFKNETININKSTQYLPENGIFDKDTKTECSNRIVPIPNYITKTLLEYKEWYDEQKDILGDKWINSNKLFIQDDGKPMYPDTIGKWFKPYIEKLGLPIIKFHGIRHTNATLMIANNVDIATVSARLGHASINTTIKYYVHPLEKNMKKAAYVLQDLLIGDN
ncbi:MAG: tyrosine-type recombinase/integrase [Clostridia bacterium]